MSDMVQKLEQEKTNELVLNARCNLKWFRENMTQPIEYLSHDNIGPTVIRIHRLIAKKVELWYRISHTKSDAMFELRAIHPE
jgi:hypothetical protein